MMSHTDPDGRATCTRSVLTSLPSKGSGIVVTITTALAAPATADGKAIAKMTAAQVNATLEAALRASFIKAELESIRAGR